MYSIYYLLGIGGIGMSAIARYFKSLGYSVSGYDRTESLLTKQLEAEGIEIHYEDRPDLIPINIDKTFVIYTPAIPEDLNEFQFVKKQGYGMCKRSKMLGLIAQGKNCLAIAGTHGKTTTSTLLAHIMHSHESGCSAFLGGISRNYESNLLVSNSNVLVAEADEYDRSFLQLKPFITAITAIDADHLDIYNDFAHVKEAFETYISQVKEDGAVIINDKIDIDLSKIKTKVYRYSYNTPCDFYASNITEKENGLYKFNINYPDGVITDCTLNIPGWINIENAIAAAAVALTYGAKPTTVRNALASFKGVARRFDVRINTEKITYIDDYAHHPQELESAISSLRNMFKGRKICGIFQPHLYTRTRDFADEFASALSKLDELILLPIYPARELPIEGVSSSIILDKVSIENKSIVEKENLLETIKSKEIDCLVTFGAGDIDRFVTPIEEYLKNV